MHSTLESPLHPRHSSLGHLGSRNAQHVANQDPGVPRESLDYPECMEPLDPTVPKEDPAQHRTPPVFLTGSSSRHPACPVPRAPGGSMDTLGSLESPGTLESLEDLALMGIPDPAVPQESPAPQVPEDQMVPPGTKVSHQKPTSSRDPQASLGTPAHGDLRGILVKLGKMVSLALLASVDGLGHRGLLGLLALLDPLDPLENRDHQEHRELVSARKLK